jgi:ATP-dependent HslUV protease subunit HslV
MLLVADAEDTLLLSGNGDVLEPDGGVAAIGSGGPMALAAARALAAHTAQNPRQIVEHSLFVASEICVYTNHEITIEELGHE